MNLRSLSAALFLVSTLTGCAFSSGTVPLNYSPAAGLGSKQGAELTKSFSVGAIADERGREPMFLMNKINGYGQKTSGMYLAERPVSEIVRDAVREALLTNKYPAADDKSSRKLTGRLLSLDFEPIMGVVNATLNVKMMVEFALVDEKTQETLWRETIVGTGSHKSGSWFAEDYLRPGFQRATDDLIRKLLANSALQQASR